MDKSIKRLWGYVVKRFNELPKVDENAVIEKAKTFKGDWNENDPSSPNYVKNRTHWVDGDKVHKLDEKFIPDTIARVEDIPTDTGGAFVVKLTVDQNNMSITLDKPYMEILEAYIEGLCPTLLMFDTSGMPVDGAFPLYAIGVTGSRSDVLVFGGLAYSNGALMYQSFTIDGVNSEPRITDMSAKMITTTNVG